MKMVEDLGIHPNVYYTIDEAAQLLRVSQEDVLELLQLGRVHGVRIGQQWRVLGAALLDLAVGQQNHGLTESDYAPLDELVGLVETGDTTAASDHDGRLYRR